MSMSNEPTTALQGALVRVGRDCWQWSDGTPEPRVRDLSPSAHYNLRCRPGLVEVPLRLAMEEDALAWVLEGRRAGRYRSGLDGDRTGPRDASTGRRMHVRPGDDPMKGHVADADPLPGRVPEVVLVPTAEWDAWAAEHPVGAEWDQEHEAAILLRAEELRG